MAILYETIRYDLDDRVAIVGLNRPEKHNAFNLKMCAELPQAIGEADLDPAVRVIILTGAGGRAFSAGYDMTESAQSITAQTAQQRRDRTADALQFARCVWDCSKPVIAMIEGHCLAGALELAQMCDIRYCADDARFGVLETRFSHGLVAMIMPWVLGPYCRELIYTGDTIGASEAMRIGLVTRVYPKVTLQAEVLKIAKRMSQVSLSCLQWNKRAINHSYETMGLNEALRYGVEACTLMNVQGSPEGDHFDELRQTKGLAAALKWREQQFAQYE